MKQNSRWSRIGLVIMAVVLVGAMICTISAQAEKASHPELSDQEMLIDCAQCHQEATPEVEKQWFDSVHGISMVKCYQCHGTFETFVVTPEVSNCATCHVAMTEVEHSENKLCWECHTPHTFKAD